MISKILKSEFLKNVATMMTGTAIAQAIPILISPILSRLYTPEHFGVLALFVSISAVISVMVTGRYELAVMLPKEDKDAVAIIALSLLSTIIISGISLVILLFFSDDITVFFDEPAIANWLYFIPLVVLFAGIYQTFNYWSTRKKTFKINALSKISQTSAAGSSNILFGFLKFGEAGLILGFIFGQIAAALMLAFRAFSTIKQYFGKITFKDLLSNGKTYRNFPLFNMPHALLNTLSSNFPVLLLTRYFAISYIGSYNFSIYVILTPLTLISYTTAQVLYQKISSLSNAGDPVTPAIRKVVIQLVKIGLVPFLIVFAFTPWIFEIVFGSEWLDAGRYAQVLLPSFFMVFIVSTISFVPAALGHQRKALILEVIYFLLKLSAMIIGIYAEDFFLAIILFSIAGIGMLTYNLFWIFRIAKHHDLRLNSSKSIHL